MDVIVDDETAGEPVDGIVDAIVDERLCRGMDVIGR